MLEHSFWQVSCKKHPQITCGVFIWGPSGFVGAHPVGRSLAQNLGVSQKCRQTLLSHRPSWLLSLHWERVTELFGRCVETQDERICESQPRSLTASLPRKNSGWKTILSYWVSVKKIRGELLNFGRVYHRFRLRWTKGSLDGVRNFSCSRVAKVVRGLPIYKCWQLETLNFGRRFGFQFFFPMNLGYKSSLDMMFFVWTSWSHVATLEQVATTCCVQLI